MKKSFGARTSARKHLMVMDCSEGYEGDMREFRQELACPTMIWISAIYDLVSHDLQQEYTDSEVYEHVYGTCNLLSMNVWDERVDQVLCQRVFGHAARRIRAEVLSVCSRTQSTTLGALSNYHNGRLELEIILTCP